jgi:hypothetical protein
VAASGLPAGLGATIAVGSRLAFLLVDVAGVALTAPWHRRPAGVGDGHRDDDRTEPAPTAAR